jgi:hypothetical protein
MIKPRDNPETDLRKGEAKEISLDLDKGLDDRAFRGGRIGGEGEGAEEENRLSHVRWRTGGDVGEKGTSGGRRKSR